MIHFLFPEKVFLHHLIGMTGTFFALYLSFFFIFYYSIILMASLAFFFLKHVLGYNVYPKFQRPRPSFLDEDFAIFHCRFLLFLRWKLRNGFISVCSLYLLHNKQLKPSQGFVTCSCPTNVCWTDRYIPFPLFANISCRSHADYQRSNRHCWSQSVNKPNTYVQAR